LTDDPQLIAGWQPFFTVTGGAAAALAGLLFVALSIHAPEIAEHPPFRYRALATLSIPLVVLVVSALALVPRQTGRSLGLEEFHCYSPPYTLEGAARCDEPDWRERRDAVEREIGVWGRGSCNGISGAPAGRQRTCGRI
jgi:hypothetical protein